MLTKTFAYFLSTAVAVGCFIDVRPAHACGGCFHAETDTSTSFVTDHRMAISISTTQTVLWDQVKYTGNPAEFAWVLPVRAGTRVELARDEWLEALEQATKPAVKGPDLTCSPQSSSSGGSTGAYGGGSYSSGGSYRGNYGGGGGGGGGCLGTSTSNSAGASSMDGEDASIAVDGAASSSSQDAGFQSAGDVQVVGQDVVGPYASVIVRSSKGAAIYDWLHANGFAVPADIAPILAGYTAQGFDFLALRLRPNVGVAAMQPVRVVMPGAVTTLPLRMVAAGIGAKVGIELFVVTEGRMRPKNFPEAVVDPRALAWDLAQQRSNYRELVERAFAANERTWITEYAGPLFDEYSYSNGRLAGSNITVALDRYYGTACLGLGPITVACNLPSDDDHVLPPPPLDGGAPLDAAVSDAADAAHASDGDDGGAADAEIDAAVDAEVITPPPCTETKDACDFFDDATTALTGLHRADVWVTRLRAELDAKACAASDLELEAHPQQTEVSAQLATNTFTDPSADPCPNRRRSSSPSPSPSPSYTSSPAYADDSVDGTQGSAGCGCSTTGESVPVSPLLGAAGVLAVLHGGSRRRRRG